MSNTISHSETEEESLSRAYTVEVCDKTLKAGRRLAIFGIPIIAVFACQDIFVLGLKNFWVWRLVQAFPCALFLALSYTYFRVNRRLIVIFHAISLLGIIAGTVGMVVVAHSSIDFSPHSRESVINGLTVAFLCVFVIASGARRYLAYLLGIPLVFLLAYFLFSPALTFEDVTNLSNPAAIAIVGIAMAVMREKAALQEFRERRRLYIKDWVIHSAINPIIIADLSGIITYVNPAYLRLWGHESAGEIVGQSLEKIGRVGEKLRKIIAVLRTGGEWIGEATAISKDGSSFEVQIVANMVVNNAGQPVCIQASIQDLTDCKRAEKQKEEMRGQLFHAEKLASLGTLVAGIAHEINNPLAIVKGFTFMLAKKLQAINHAEDVDRSLSKINSAINRIATIVKSLRTYAQADTEKVDMVDIHKIIGEVIIFVQHITKSAGINIHHDFAADTLLISGSTGKIQQVFFNLLTNACDALKSRPNDRQIIITTQVESEDIVISFSDNGCGISEAALGKIFDPFFTTKPTGHGTGLGLSISYSIVESLGGTFKVSSQEGIGTTFKITLPRCGPRVMTNYSGYKTKKDVIPPCLHGEVLVVDDEPALGELLKNYLEEAQLTVTVMVDAVAALELMARKSFDVIITDVQMPGLSGINLIRKARDFEMQAGARFIVITGGIFHSYSEDDQHLLRESALGQLVKPFEQRQLLELVSKALLPA